MLANVTNDVTEMILVANQAVEVVLLPKRVVAAEFAIDLAGCEGLPGRDDFCEIFVY